MKTLDEVVESYEISNGNKDCSQCPYDDECYDHHVCECYERMADTYHYLKEYKERLQNIQDMMDRYDVSVKNYEEAVENCRIAEQKYWRMTNNIEELTPLTWEQLKQMEGKPVWVEEKYSFNKEWHGRWEVICSVWDNEWDDDPYLSMTDEEYRHKDDMGERWQAYRKERQ